MEFQVNSKNIFMSGYFSQFDDVKAESKQSHHALFLVFAVPKDEGPIIHLLTHSMTLPMPFRRSRAYSGTDIHSPGGSDEAHDPYERNCSRRFRIRRGASVDSLTVVSTLSAALIRRSRFDSSARCV